jgi:hypothetical protein
MCDANSRRQEIMELWFGVSIREDLSRYTFVKILSIRKLSKVWWESGVVVMPILT